MLTETELFVRWVWAVSPFGIWRDAPAVLRKHPIDRSSPLFIDVEKLKAAGWIEYKPDGQVGR